MMFDSISQWIYFINFSIISIRLFVYTTANSWTTKNAEIVQNTDADTEENYILLSVWSFQIVVDLIVLPIWRALRPFNLEKTFSIQLRKNILLYPTKKWIERTSRYQHLNKMHYIFAKNHHQHHLSIEIFAHNTKHTTNSISTYNLDVLMCLSFLYFRGEN